jgi:hypothetical protein
VTKGLAFQPNTAGGNRLRRKAAFAVVTLAFSTTTFAHELDPEVRVFHVPDVGRVETISAGTAIHEYRRTYSFTATVPDIQMKGGGNWFFPVTVEAGTHMFPEPSKAKFKACSKDGSCGYDDDGDGIFDRMRGAGSSRSPKLKIPVPYHTERITVDSPEDDRQILIYSGATGNSLRVSYREFRENFERPALSEELTIPIAKKFPQDVAIKQIRIRIHAINGLGMRYEVLP